MQSTHITGPVTTMAGATDGPAGITCPALTASSGPAALDRTTARQWIETVVRALPGMSPSEAFDAITAYDRIHLMAYDTPADPALLNRYTLRAFEAMIQGDSAIDPYAMYRRISERLRHNDSAYLGRPLRWLSESLARWHREIRLNLLTVSAPDRDTLQQAAILMEADLRAYEGSNQTAFKRRLSTRYRKYLRPLPSTNATTR